VPPPSVLHRRQGLNPVSSTPPRGNFSPP
jgi:hypothetical protein